MGKKEGIGSHQERSDKENLSVERRQHKKYQQIEYDMKAKFGHGLEKIHLC